ncbi:hypothetical protein EJ076_29540 [Mesorhizobium sp. M7D.F.Ca.US.005.01.1.1]|uniref:hypothetical protein n=1 Tax=Mesorhizobium sp. M7D.F.Ca.US.005.01.1.1 TaxID=2493678 RepID=UPI000F75E170|nr:hypothetical protein [Mesorhizobium sp. M7D.F.Ca.US.005.01.1.1]AZO44951.1 hypothetical protein EJ076_29540 [Mesorhizobium sp. M7D.F.Ca.US.005.01.1.1]
MDHEKISAELDVLREFIDFVNRQVGVYCDCLSGFQGNKVRMERQIPRVQRPTSRRIVDGQPVVAYVSVEDPSRPDIVHHRIIRADEFINVNAEGAFNEQQICWAIIVFIFSTWDEEIRPRIAAIRGIKPDDIMLNEMGDLRILRKAIIHNSGKVSAKEYAKLKVMTDLCQPNTPLAFRHDEMHAVFVHVKRGIGRLINEHFGHLPGAPDPASIIGVAISRNGQT